LVREVLTNRVSEELQGMKQARALFPSWTTRGLPDGIVHSAGISLITAIGQILGYESYSEMPAPHIGRYAYVGDDVRSDSAWFDRSSGRAVLLAEFERYAGTVDEGKLMSKVENLLLAQHRWEETPACAVLAYWTKSLRDLPDHEVLVSQYRRGFQTRAMESVDGTSSSCLLICQFILRESDPGKWRLDLVKQRGVR
jgi:hypothetical protein